MWKEREYIYESYRIRISENRTGNHGKAADEKMNPNNEER
jgi:hypothetical protein